MVQHAWSGSRVAREISKRCQIGPPATIAGATISTTRGTIRGLLRFSKDRYLPDTLLWNAFVGDENYWDSFGGGGIWLEILPPPKFAETTDYPWPVSGQQLPAGLIEDIARYAIPAMEFVASRVDLASLLLQEGEVRRGELRAQLTENTSPSRLVKAVILARELGDHQIEQAAFQKLRSQHEKRLHGVPYEKLVAQWAREYASDTDVDIRDLSRAGSGRT
ncbi:MAG TPA: hypothetical protein VMU51_04065 [Mycobacteriales bacterium]|nr:hypothetical protein [Mycobacteriales bacterium]